MEPLYCFKYEEDTGKISKIVIPEYGISTNKFTDRKTYYFNKPKINKSDSLYQVPETKLDRYVSNKVYTFNGDIQNAKRIVLEEMTGKCQKAFIDYNRWYACVSQFLLSNPEFDNEEVAI